MCDDVGMDSPRVLAADPRPASQDAPSYTSTRAVTSRIRTGINHLPNELLSLILAHLYDNSRKHDWIELISRDEGEPVSSEWDESDDLRAPSLFPYAPWAVSRRWRSAMVIVPMFWTRLVLRVGKSATPLEDVAAQLTRSADLLLEVNVVRWDYDDGVSEDVEGQQVAAVMALVKPHLHRAQRLRFDVFAGASLPSLCGDFEGTAEHLVSLKLDSRVCGNAEVDEPASVDFECPQLQTLHLDGRNYCAVEGNDWLDSERFSGVTHLRIAHHRGGGISVDDLIISLGKFPSLQALAICDVECRGSSNVAGFPVMSLPYLCGISLEYLEGQLAGAVLCSFDETSLEDVSIVACPLTVPNPGLIVESATLSLEKIAADQDPVPFLHNWGEGLGASVEFVDCACLTAAVFASLAVGGQTDDDWVCPHLRYLTIRECSGFSVRGLRDMVRARASASLRYADEAYDPDVKIRAIDILTVRNCGTALSVDDQEWFKSNVSVFVYEG
ncbi:hypothetical protein PLICRDRAFT_219964 [Plicaturopsis crispa FD-325 SS-3]|nr:hypothetical protein PLICRDRAFT_219964 [Plicaturopsis crispa FD-325 SS-3]